MMGKHEYDLLVHDDIHRHLKTTVAEAMKVSQQVHETMRKMTMRMEKLFNQFQIMEVLKMMRKQAHETMRMKKVMRKKMMMIKKKLKMELEIWNQNLSMGAQ